MRVTHEVWIDGRCVPLRVLIADRLWSRARGLLFRRAAARPDAALLTPCAAIHTFGISQPLDLVFTDPPGRVLACVDGARPWRAFALRGAHATWELRAGLRHDLGLRPGSCIRLGETIRSSGSRLP